MMFKYADCEKSIKEAHECLEKEYDPSISLTIDLSDELEAVLRAYEIARDIIRRHNYEENPNVVFRSEAVAFLNKYPGKI